MSRGIQPVIYGCSGLTLTPDEAAFFKDSNPLGLILFARNCQSFDQLAALVESFRACVGWEAPILIDQEGGRVQRMKPPEFPTAYPPAQSLVGTGNPDALHHAKTHYYTLAKELSSIGINVNCAPVLDVLQSQTHDVIGDRAFSKDPDIVAAYGVAACQAHIEAGVIPVIKHLPGHGRATLDSHKDLPRVDTDLTQLEVHDFKPFRDIAHAPFGQNVWGMVAHILFTAIDNHLPSSASPAIIKEIIRDQIAFDGFLVSDDLFMEALEGLGDMADRANACLDAGCDAVLHCHGSVADMVKVANSVGDMGQVSRNRLRKSYDMVKRSV